MAWTTVLARSFCLPRSPSWCYNPVLLAVIARTSVAFVFLALLLSGRVAQAQKKKGEEEDITQTLAALKDPPAAVTADTAHLSFQVSPLSAKGLLSQQVRDALKELLHSSRGGAIVKLRAFVAGSGDLRRVQNLVSETFTERKLALPALTTIQAGALPMAGAQVVMESATTDKKIVNPQGLAFFSGQTVEQLQASARAAGVASGSMLRVTCFLNSLDQAPKVRSAIAAAFPSAAANYIQLQRLESGPVVACEGVGRLEKPSASTLIMSGSAALVNSSKLVITGAQMAFGEEDRDVRLAFERLRKTMDALGAGYKDMFWSGTYAVTRRMSDEAGKIGAEFYDPSRTPAGTSLQFEGLPSLDSSVAIEAIAAVN